MTIELEDFTWKKLRSEIHNMEEMLLNNNKFSFFIDLINFNR